MGRYHFQVHWLGPTQRMLWKEGFSLSGFFPCSRYPNCLKQYRRHGCPRFFQTKFWCFSVYVNLCTCSSPAATPSGLNKLTWWWKPQELATWSATHWTFCRNRQGWLDVFLGSDCIFCVILEFWGRFCFLINQWGVRNILYAMCYSLEISKYIL